VVKLRVKLRLPFTPSRFRCKFRCKFRYRYPPLLGNGGISFLSRRLTFTFDFLSPRSSVVIYSAPRSSVVIYVLLLITRQTHIITRSNYHTARQTFNDKQPRIRQALLQAGTREKALIAAPSFAASWDLLAKHPHLRRPTLPLQSL
jgi:hypothetical protein